MSPREWIVLSLTLWSLPSHAVIFGFDDRHPVDPKVAPYNRVFRLSTGCTAALVGESLILTAAHCVEHEYIRTERSKAIFGERAVSITDGTDPRKEVAYVTRGNLGTYRSESFWEYDWALLEIDRPLGKTRGFFEVDASFKSSTQGDSKDLMLPGFPGDRPGDGLLAHIGCSALMFFSQNRLFRTDCDGWGGNSGGPYLQRSSPSDPWKVIGVFSRALREYREVPDPRFGNVGVNSSEFFSAWKEYLGELKSSSSH